VLFSSISHLFVFFITFFSLINSIAVDNNIGDDGAKFISEGMKEDTVITNLELGRMFNIYFNFSQVLVLRCFSHFLFLDCFLIFSFP